MTTHPCRILTFALLLLGISWPGFTRAQTNVTFTAAELAAAPHQPIDGQTRLREIGGRQAVELVAPENQTQQLLRVGEVAFRTGTLEFDFFAAESSKFIGIAWHLSSKEDYEAVYFRPFRFRDSDPVGSRHAVQYISHPTYTWRKLRTDFPDVYEGPCPIDPGQWIRVRLEVASQSIRVFAGDLAAPVLVVERPFLRNGTGIALWTGASTTGAFANLSIAPNGPPTPPTPTTAASDPAPSFLAIEPAKGESIDLLATIDPERDAVAGTWRKTEAGLEVEPQEFARIAIPQDFPTSYDLDVSFTRQGGKDESVSTYLPVGENGASVLFAVRGTHDGIGMIDGVPIWMGAAKRDSLLRTGERAEASIRVRQRGDRVRIAQYLNGKPHVSWEGPLTSLSIYERVRIPEGKAGLGAFASNTVFHEARLTPASQN